MNRLVIIGNGFDLAHGLPTSYKDFIEDYWITVIIKLKNDLYYKDFFIEIDFSYLKNNPYDYIDWENVLDYKSLVSSIKNSSNGSLKFLNSFFNLLCSGLNVRNWVDIENEYYLQLKTIVKKTGILNEEKEEFVKNLNNEFEQVKKLLERYLQNNVLNKFNFELFPDPNGKYLKIQNLLKPILYTESEIENELPNEDSEEITKTLTEQIETKIRNTSLYLLNFNYTPTVQRYLNHTLKNIAKSIDVNYIHGFIGDDEVYKINFGFGDEMDDDYKDIENLDNNEYLKNFKSFQYLQNSNYKHLLDFIHNEKFQVYIMGHSCGLSDRILLNTIFEHENCRSIKVFYHKKPDESDNYTDLIQNISRHFNDKKLMRSKIVNKTLSQPLPQIQLPKKE